MCQGICALKSNPPTFWVFGPKIGQKHLKKGLKRFYLVWYGLVMTQLWSLVNLEMSKPKKINSNSQYSDSEIQLKWQIFGFFIFTFLDILTTIYDFDLQGMSQDHKYVMTKLYQTK